ncbi:MAG: hypothetical protein IIA64_11335 [Planctomycetes bacterium]|nr:hypothetical protein [Planctomycetota bacterium]
MNSSTKIINMAMVAVLLFVVCAAVAGCDNRTGAARRSPAGTEVGSVSNSDATAEAIEESERVDVIPPVSVVIPPVSVVIPPEPVEAPPEQIAPASAGDVASTLADARTTLGETMKALEEILDASQRLQRELLEAPERLSSPTRSDDGGEEEG